MKKLLSVILLIGIVGAVWKLHDLLDDKSTLQENLIRLHVVANSDSMEDQSVKMQVKEAVVAYLQPRLETITDKKNAMILLKDELAEIEAVANNLLVQMGINQTATAAIGEEKFMTRHYDTFSLPAGIYDALRITIGDGEGQNWWCVVFPSLCIPAEGQELQDTAVAVGFDQDLIDTITHQKGYEIRFFLLDWLGKKEI